MRVQLIASLALLQFHSLAAAAATPNMGSNTLFDTSGTQGTATRPSGHSSHDSKPQASHGAGMHGSKDGASSGHGFDTTGKGLPRMVDFHGIHVSPASGGVVHPSDSARWNRRTVPSAVALPDSDAEWDSACDLSPNIDLSTPAGINKRCKDPASYIPDPVPADCEADHSCEAYARSITTEAGSATTQASLLPLPTAGGHVHPCPVIGRRGDFLIRRCNEETNGTPPWNGWQSFTTEATIGTVATKPALTTGQ
ncbi:hypothetical protein N0V93_006464 [Gnomoniopsis smithogilvyi]|uniref:Uncharacterized protein n=1 Tax=Gnomoniopsis smithogilvyi TaxID=1191159 RepID=A0A9W9CVR4_9PEZI|nr:hypothetical protein N0V93_006464 [Gnomoniopsis smithogilvyi]